MIAAEAIVADRPEAVAQEMLSASFWMEVRKAQNRSRSFGTAPTNALQAVRGVMPWQLATDLRPELPAGELIYAFMNAVPAATFMGPAAAEPTAVRTRTMRAVKRGKRRRAVLRRQARERTPGPQVIVRR